MPSTIVHVAVGALLGIALLGEEFDTRAILLILGIVAIPDLDTLIGIVLPGTHRAMLHNLFLILLPAAILVWDVAYREESFVLSRWGRYGYRIAWVSLVVLLFAHLLLDAFYNGANLLWPLHDRFYDFSGKLWITDQRGIVQTFVEFDRGADGSTSVSGSTSRGTTENTHYSTGFDPTREESPEDVERIFPIAETGELFVLTVVGYLTLAYRIAADRR